mmetsp:Transcript_17801/g.43577  ORF Transcript_17801/g.43577 Transcript_17801/m.43577 type:complete len:1129 (-) Transcript_17801:373-3759(-)
MGLTASKNIPASAPIYPKEYIPNYDDAKAPHYVMFKHEEGRIVFAKSGPASDKEGEGLPPTTIPELLKKAGTGINKGKPALLVERDENGNYPEIEEKGNIPGPVPRDDWKKWTYEQYYQDCEHFATSCVAVGAKQFGTVAIWGFNSPEWVIAAMGSTCFGGKFAGIYPTDTPKQVQFKLHHSSADVMVVEDLKKHDAVKKIVEELPDLKAIVIWGATVENDEIKRSKGEPVKVFSWKSFLETAKDDEGKSKKDLEGMRSKIKPGHCAALVYTSGTTGKPKAVMLSHDNVIFEISAGSREFDFMGSSAQPERQLSYLPLSHVAGFDADIGIPLWTTAMSPSWVEIYFARPYDLRAGSLRDRLICIKPTIFIGVPRVWEKIAEKMQARAKSISGTKKSLATWAKKKGLLFAEACNLGGKGSAPFMYSLANTLVLKRVKLALGLEECKIGLAGAAPMQKHTQEYYGSLGINVNEMYGMSETTGAITISTETCHMWGTVGYPLPGCEIKVFRRSGENEVKNKVEASPARDLFHPKPSEEGEICFRGRNNMMGYLANPALGDAHVALIKKKNEEAIDSEGWLHSGDKGSIGKNGMLMITGRYKEIIIGAGGENVAPVPIEDNVKKECELVSNIMMFGDKKKFNVCLITLRSQDSTGFEPGGDELDFTASNFVDGITKISQAVESKGYIDEIWRAIDATNNNGEISPSRSSNIQKFTILPRDFSVETGELTSTLKLKRSVVAKMYKEVLDRMYESKDTYVPFNIKTETKNGGDDNKLPTLSPQPKNPIGKITLIECRGGSDKAANGHRKDTIPICNAIIERGWECKPIYYTDADYKTVEAEIMSSKGYICRVNPGTYTGVTQSKLDDLLNSAVKKGIKGMSSPESMKRMGAKDALVKINKLRCGLPSTAAYYTMDEVMEGFSKTIVSGIRVLKQNRGSQGEGIWVCSLKEGEEKKIENGKCPPGTMLTLQEAVDNHKEEKSLEEFVKFCNVYLEGEGGQLVDQKFLPRIVEGEVRVFMIGDTPIELVHKKPAEGGISATLKSGAKYVRYAPDEAKFSQLMDSFKADLPKLMTALEIGDEPLPLLWTTDFIPGPVVDGKDTYYIGEFNCSCVGITKQLNLAGMVAEAAIKVCGAS